MTVSILVAVAENGAIGKNNSLIWKLSDDLKLFKKRTSGHSVIMGRKTYDSIGRPLPNRRNIVISTNKTLTIEGCEVVSSLENALILLHREEEVFIIGGEKIYNLAMGVANKIYLTQVKTRLEGDVFFNYQPFMNWRLLSKTSYLASDKNQYPFEVLELVKP
jgi:dihydrofolate reductase